MREFNAAGPSRSDDHYRLTPLDRVNLAEVLSFVRGERHFAIRAPRETGKTTVLLTLRALLNGGSVGDYRCAYINVDLAGMAGEDVGCAMGAIASDIAREARHALGDERTAEAADSLDTARQPHSSLLTLLNAWARADTRPLVLLIDNIDSLADGPLASVLRQLRTGYVRRPEGFPQSVILCGESGLRDHQFDLTAASLSLAHFSLAEIDALLGQHAAATGQAFAPEAVDAVWAQTRGHPWLVNALAQRMCFSAGTLREREGPIRRRDVFEAREALILRRDPHLNRMADKLRKPGLRRVIQPLLTGDDTAYDSRDLEYARDIGLVEAELAIRIANPIYREVLSRSLIRFCAGRGEGAVGSSWSAAVGGWGA